LKRARYDEKDYSKDIQEAGLLEIVNDLGKDADLAENANLILEEFLALEENREKAQKKGGKTKIM